MAKKTAKKEPKKKAKSAPKKKPAVKKAKPKSKPKAKAKKPAKKPAPKKKPSHEVVEAGAQVGLAFQMFAIGSDATESLFAEFHEDDPTERTIGEAVDKGDMWDHLRQLESSLLGRAPGEGFDLHIPAADASGPRLDEKVHVLEGERMKEFLCDCSVGPDGWNCFDVGGWIEGDEIRIEGILLEASPEKMVIDANHKLAGKDLRIAGKIVFVR
jgi:FKBP-type peptidyl-prolyl cis-trans isomerase 2